MPKAKAAKRTTADSRNPELARGIGRYGRSKMYSRSGRWAVKSKKATAKKAEVVKAAVKKVGGAKNGGERKIAAKTARYYPTEDAPHKLHSNKAKAKPTKLRSDIAPGQVLIVLAGRFRGRRVVFLNQLASGLLLVTGPYKVNGVPLRRINQVYVQATNMKVDVSGVKLDAKVNDTFFKAAAKKASKKSEEEFFGQEKKAEKSIDADRKKIQVAVDASLVKAITKDSALKAYLGARFSLTKGQYPHELKF